jgi:cbb3-type cytochrome oxidase subunit 3
MAEAEYAIALYMWIKINKHKYNQEEQSIMLSKDKITIVTSEEG